MKRQTYFAVLHGKSYVRTEWRLTRALYEFVDMVTRETRSYFLF
jgi:hypothetical protein